MKVATWNINGVKARLESALAYLRQASPDVICLQEIKSVDEGFPGGAFEELGYNVEIGNWRGVYAPPGITPAQRQALTDLVVKATKSKAWAEALEKNGWTPAVLTGKDFEDFVDREFASLRAIMVKSGMVG